MHSAALDEDAQEDQEEDAEQYAQIPVFDDVLLERVQRLLVEQQILQPHQWAVGIDRAALEEHVAVSLEVITWRARTKADALLRQSVEMSELAGGAARVDVGAVLTRQLAQPAFIEVVLSRAEEAFSLVPAEANRSGALAADAQLRPVVALRLVLPRLRLRALARRSIAHRAPRALRLLAAPRAQFGGNERAAVRVAARALAGTALRARPPAAALGGRVERQVVLADDPGIAAAVAALVVVEAAVALLADLHDLVAAEGALADLEAVALLRVVDGVQHVGDVADRALREFAVVGPIAAGST